MVNFKLGVFVIALSVGIAFGAPLKVKSANVEFLAKGNPGAIKIRGKAKETSDLETKLDLTQGVLKGSVTLKLANLDTGIELRDKHMKEKYLEVGKFPTSQFTFSPLSLTSGSLKELPFEGQLNLHGVDKKVAGTVSGNGTSSDTDLEFNFKIKTKDFAIDTPSFMGVTMADEVSVTVQISGKAQ